MVIIIEQTEENPTETDLLSVKITRTSNVGALMGGASATIVINTP